MKPAPRRTPLYLISLLVFNLVLIATPTGASLPDKYSDQQPGHSPAVSVPAKSKTHAAGDTSNDENSSTKPANQQPGQVAKQPKRNNHPPRTGDGNQPGTACNCPCASDAAS